MHWAYGITTVHSRLGNLFPRTLASLARAGFDAPRIFVDGVRDASDYWQFGLEVTTRYPAIKAYPHWALSLLELYFRDHQAEMYAIFQDDCIACLNLRRYLERSYCDVENKYLNLYTFPHNQDLCPGKKYRGWFLADQMGKGAVGLVFSRQVLMKLMAAPHMTERIHETHGWKKIDGAVVESLRRIGVKEYVHSPSLLQHTGTVSTVRNPLHPTAVSFPGESFDALSLLGK